MAPVFHDPICWLSYHYFGHPTAQAVGTVCFVLFYFFHEVAIGPQEAKGQSDAITQLARKQKLSTDSLQVP